MAYTLKFLSSTTPPIGNITLRFGGDFVVCEECLISTEVSLSQIKKDEILQIPEIEIPLSVSLEGAACDEIVKVTEIVELSINLSCEEPHQRIIEINIDFTFEMSMVYHLITPVPELPLIVKHGVTPLYTDILNSTIVKSGFNIPGFLIATFGTDSNDNKINIFLTTNTSVIPTMGSYCGEVELGIEITLFRGRAGFLVTPPELLIPTTITITRAYHLVANIFPPETEIRFNLDSPFDPLLRIEVSCLSIDVSHSIPETLLSIITESDYKWTQFQPIVNPVELDIFPYCDIVFIKSNNLINTHTFNIPTGYETYSPNYPAIDTYQVGLRFGESVAISGDGLTVAISANGWMEDVDTSIPKTFIWKKTSSWNLHCVIDNCGNVFSLNYDGSLLIANKIYRLFPVTPYYNIFSNITGNASSNFTYLTKINGYVVEIYQINNKIIVPYSAITTPYYPAVSSISNDGNIVITLSTTGVLDTYKSNSGGYLLINSFIPRLSTGQVYANYYAGGPWDVLTNVSGRGNIQLTGDGLELIIYGAAIYRWVESSWVEYGCITKIDNKINVSVAISENNRVLSGVYGYGQTSWGVAYPSGIGSVHLYEDDNIVVPYATMIINIECDCESVIGSGFIESPELLLMVRPELLSIDLQMYSQCGDVVINMSNTTSPIYDKNQKYELRNLMISNKTEFGYSVNLSASGRIMVIGHSTGIITYDYVSPDWVKRVFELSVNNPVVCLNDSGSVLMVGEAVSNKVSVFVWEDSQWSLNQTIEGDNSGSFGCSISTSGNVLSVGAITYDSKGKVYIYDWSNDSWVFRNSISGNVVNERFGISVAMAINGTMLCIAAKMDDLFETPANIYTYDWIDFNWELRGEYEVEENSQLNYINKYRKASCDLFPLRTNMCLFNAAYAYSKDMCERQYSGHFGLPEGSSNPHIRNREAGYLDNWEGEGEPTGENLGYGSKIKHESGEFVIEGAKDSYTHAANMVSLIVPNNPDITLEEQIAQIKAHFAYLVENADYSRLDQWQEIGIGTYCDNGLYRTTHSFGFRIENNEVQYGVYNRGEQDFKHTVSLSLTEDGKLLVVGSTEWTNNYSHSGSVQTLIPFGDTWISIISDSKDSLYPMPMTLYYGSTINVVQPIAIQSPNEQFNERFGQSVSLNNTGNVMAVGANYSNDKEGRVYIFTRYPTTYQVSGIIRQGNDGVPVVTRLISVDNGEVVESIVSGNDGLFEIKNLVTDKDSDLLFHNRLQGSKNDVVQRTKPVYYLEED